MKSRTAFHLLGRAVLFALMASLSAMASVPHSKLATRHAADHARPRVFPAPGGDLLPNPASSYPELEAAIAGAPTGATAFVLRLSTIGGETPDPANSLIAFVNFGAPNGLANPQISAAESPLAPPVTLSTNGNPVQLTNLAFGQVFITEAPDYGGSVASFEVGGVLYTSHLDPGHALYNIAPAALPLPECYGVTSLVSLEDNAAVRALAGDLAAGEMNTLPSVWQTGLRVTLDQSLQAAAHHPTAVADDFGTPVVGGTRDDVASDGITIHPKAVLWNGPIGTETDIHAAVVSAAPASGFVESTVLAALAIPFDNGNDLFVDFVGYAVDGNGVEQPVLWDFSAGLIFSPSVFILQNGSRITGLNGQVQVGYQANGIVERPVLWQSNHQDMTLPSPDDTNYQGGRAEGMGSQFIAGWLWYGPEAGQTKHAVLWNADGSNPRDIHPAGFISSSLTSTAGSHVVGVGTDSSGTEHALLWEDGQLDAPLDLGPLINNSTIVQHPMGGYRPRCVDEAGNIALQLGDVDGVAGYYLRRQGASIENWITVITPGKTGITFSEKIAPQCDDVTAYYNIYQDGILVSSTSPIQIPAGTNAVILTNTITGLSFASQYYAQLFATNSTTLSFGPGLLFYTQPSNLPPQGRTNLYISPDAGQVVFNLSDLLAAASDPEGDSFDFDNLEPQMPTQAGGMLMYQFGDTIIVYTLPPPGSDIDHFDLPLVDVHGARGNLDVMIYFRLPDPVLGIGLDSAQSTATLTFNGTPGITYTIQAAASMTAPVQWQDLAALPVGTSGKATYSADTLATPWQFYRVIVK